MSVAALSWVCAVAIAVPASAQLGALPVPTLPGLPTSTITRGLGDVLDQTVGSVEGTAQVVSSATRIHRLLRTHRAQVEADPEGAPMVRARLVAVSPTASALDAARAAGFVVVDDRQMDELDIRLVQLAVPPSLSTVAALRRLREMDPAGRYDFDHIYLTSSSQPVIAAAVEPATASPAVQPLPAAATRLGLIDGGVDTLHPVFQHNAIERWGCGGKAVPSAHGTAVASLMVGDNGAYRGAAPGATLYAADVYCSEPTGGAVVFIAAALGWMAQQRVPVINVSLVGPDNLLLAQAIHVLQSRGHLIVAAVGNDGPAARPLYPAAYPGVVGVTAVDAHGRVLVEAGRGPQVCLAAPGADLPAAGLRGDYVAVRGTSFAAPIVAGLLAAKLPAPDSVASAAALAHLEAQAVDLGTRGVDTIYGVGLVGDSVRTTLTAAHLKLNRSSGRDLLE